ncbi:MAG: OmpA family protein [Thiobacillus sp.]|nr:OmpA family protein [Thiobacillus sp.]
MNMTYERYALAMLLALAGCAGQPAQDSSLSDRVATLEREVRDLSAQMKETLAYVNREKIRQDGKEAFTVQLAEDATLYPINRAGPAGADLAKLDDLVERLAKLGRDYHLEVQGHADNIGPDDYNYALAKARAEAVVRYLHEKKGIALSRMSAISYGAGQATDRPGQNNRRIVIRVLVAQ